MLAFAGWLQLDCGVAAHVHMCAKRPVQCDNNPSPGSFFASHRLWTEHSHDVGGYPTKRGAAKIIKALWQMTARLRGAEAGTARAVSVDAQVQRNRYRGMIPE